MPDFDRDPEALAWARTKLQHHIDKLARWEQQAGEQDKTEQAAHWRRVKHYLLRSFIGGRGCVIAAFDERLPEHLEMLDRAKPLGKQPEPQEQLAAVLAKASETRWRVYASGAGDWMPTSSACDTPADARRKEQQLLARHPDLPTAIVRETRTYQTEEQQ